MSVLSEVMDRPATTRDTILAAPAILFGLTCMVGLWAYIKIADLREAVTACIHPDVNNDRRW